MYEDTYKLNETNQQNKKKKTHIFPFDKWVYIAKKKEKKCFGHKRLENQNAVWFVSKFNI